MAVKYTRVRWPERLARNSRMARRKTRFYEGGQYAVYLSESIRDRAKKRVICATIAYVEKMKQFHVAVTGSLPHYTGLPFGTYVGANMNNALMRARADCRSMRDQLRAAT